jgi:hypothetical protein
MAEGGKAGLRVLRIAICFLLLMPIIDSFADEGAETTTGSGFSFVASQSIRGEGITEVRSCLNTDPQVFQSRGSGSGSYNYDSTILLTNFTTTDPARGFSSYGRSIEVQETADFAYLPLSINVGSFNTKPIKSLWDDATKTGNKGGAFVELAFANTKVLSKDVHAKTSGFEDFEDIQDSSGKFNLGLKFDVAFTGTGKVGAWLKGPTDKIPARMLDEYYSGTFKMVKNIEFSNIGTSSIDETNDELNCTCLKGYDSWDLADQTWASHSVKDFFNCSC